MTADVPWDDPTLRSLWVTAQGRAGSTSLPLTPRGNSMFPHLRPRFPPPMARRRNVTGQLRVEDLESRALLTLTAINFGATIESTPVPIHGELFFPGYDPAHGTQLWESN